MRVRRLFGLSLRAAMDGMCGCGGIQKRASVRGYGCSNGAARTRMMPGCSMDLFLHSLTSIQINAYVDLVDGQL